ncbi:MAG: hypothetical protein NZ480_01905 [Bdellovibrionaceae bacterium]|nr:hypothetical protein [Pseudobdellovibrionaceae bacterium]MDW8191003.1 hypothetical protein [Pseudobdellovibrionaceae bacterium]
MSDFILRNKVPIIVIVVIFALLIGYRSFQKNNKLVPQSPNISPSQGELPAAATGTNLQTSQNIFSNKVTGEGSADAAFNQMPSKGLSQSSEEALKAINDYAGIEVPWPKNWNYTLLDADDPNTLLMTASDKNTASVVNFAATRHLLTREEVIQLAKSYADSLPGLTQINSTDIKEYPIPATLLEAKGFKSGFLLEKVDEKNANSDKSYFALVGLTRSDGAGMYVISVEGKASYWKDNEEVVDRIIENIKLKPVPNNK